MKTCRGNYYLIKYLKTSRRLKRTGNILKQLLPFILVAVDNQHWTPARRALVKKATRAAVRATA